MYDEIIERAKRAYCRTGDVPEPGNCSEVVEWGTRTYVKLSNVNGVLAVYRYYPESNRLKRSGLFCVKS